MKKIIAFSLSVLFIIPAFAAITGNPETESPKFNLTVGTGKSEDLIHIKNLANLRDQVLAPALEGYELVSFTIMVVPKGEQFIIDKVQGDKVSPYVFYSLKKLKAGSEIIISDITAKNNKNKIKTLSIITYDIIDDESPLENPETESPKFNFILGGNNGDYIHTKKLENLKEDVLVTPNWKKLEGYEIVSFAVLIIPKTGEAIITYFQGNKLSAELVERLKARKAGDRILFDQVKAKNSQNEMRNLSPAVFTIIDDDYRTSITIGSPGDISIKTLSLLSDKETIKIETEHTEAGFVLSSFKLQINHQSDKQDSEYEINGNTLPADILKEFKTLPARTIITFSEVIAVNKETGEKKRLNPSVYMVVE